MSKKPEKLVKVKMWAVKFQDGSFSPVLETLKPDAEYRVDFLNHKKNQPLAHACKVVRVLVQELAEERKQ